MAATSPAQAVYDGLILASERVAFRLISRMTRFRRSDSIRWAGRVDAADDHALHGTRDFPFTRERAIQFAHRQTERNVLVRGRRTWLRRGVEAVLWLVVFVATSRPLGKLDRSDAGALREALRVARCCQASGRRCRGSAWLVITDRPSTSRMTS